MLPLIAAIATAPATAADAPLRYDFGGQAAPGFIKVDPTSVFPAAGNSGFDLGTKPRRVDETAANALHDGYCTSDRPFCFSVALPEGNHQVKLTFGSGTGPTATTVKAESRRLMLEQVVTKAGEFVTKTITISVRTPVLASGGKVKLKTRELGPPPVLHWDDKLTLEFNGAHPGLTALEVIPAPRVPTVFLVGDSTVTDQPLEPWCSWGQMLTRFFGPGVAVANHADSGESLRSSYGSNRIQKVLESMKAGDFLLIQFGHNDMKDRAPDALDRYRDHLRRLVRETRERRATPVLVTPMERMAGVTAPTLGAYPAAVREIAAAQQVDLIDLNTASLALYQALGGKLRLAFQDGSHHNAYGAYELAKCVAEGIRGRQLPIAKFLAEDFVPFDPAQPDDPERFAIPASPQQSDRKPDGS